MTRGEEICTSGDWVVPITATCLVLVSNFHIQKFICLPQHQFQPAGTGIAGAWNADGCEIAGASTNVTGEKALHLPEPAASLYYIHSGFAIKPALYYLLLMATGGQSWLRKRGCRNSFIRSHPNRGPCGSVLSTTGIISSSRNKPLHNSDGNSAHVEIFFKRLG